MKSKIKKWGVCLSIKDIPPSYVLRVLQGGYSSIHRHPHHYNVFIPKSGDVDVCVYLNSEWKFIELTRPVVVDPGVFHAFVAHSASEIEEMYIPTLECSEKLTIERISFGGLVRPDELDDIIEYIKLTNPHFYAISMSSETL